MGIGENVGENTGQNTGQEGYRSQSVPPPSGDELFVDSFASGDFSHTENGVSWGSLQGGSGEVPVVSSDISRTGSYSVKYTFIGGSSSDDAWSETRIRLGQNLAELYMRYYVYFPNGTEGLGAKYKHRNASGPDNNKFLRIWADGYTGSSCKVGYSTWQLDDNTDATSMVSEAGSTGNSIDYVAVANNAIGDSQLGRWVKFNIHTKIDSGASDGILHMQMDDVDVLNHQSLANYPTDGLGNYFNNCYLMGWSNSGFDDTTYVYIDDLTISEIPIG